MSNRIQISTSSPLKAAAARINRRLRRVCSLLHEPATVDSAPLRFVMWATIPTTREVHSRLDRIIRIQYARTLDELNAEHDRNSLAYVAGELSRRDHDDLAAMFLTRHRDYLRKAVVCNPLQSVWPR